MTVDKGFAPNPFWDVCTLACCTPNKRNAHLDKNDWIVGVSSKASGNRIIYAMRIKERLNHDDYYQGGLYEQKKPAPTDWRTRCGDNIYFKENGVWKRDSEACYHIGPHDMDKDVGDTKDALVFAGEEFYYFGRNAVLLPKNALLSKIKLQSRMRYERDAKVCDAFKDWIRNKYKTGCDGNLPTHAEAGNEGGGGDHSPSRACS